MSRVIDDAALINALYEINVFIDDAARVLARTSLRRPPHEPRASESNNVIDDETASSPELHCDERHTNELLNRTTSSTTKRASSPTSLRRTLHESRALLNQRNVIDDEARVFADIAATNAARMTGF